MKHIILSKDQLKGKLCVELCSTKDIADNRRKMLLNTYNDVVVLSEDDYKFIASTSIKNTIKNQQSDNYYACISPDPIWNGPSEDLVDVVGYGGDEEAHKSWDKEGEGKVIAETFMNPFGVEQVDLGPQRFHEDEEGDEYYLSSNGKRYYLFSQVVTLKGNREQIIYTFGKKEWSKRNNHRLLRFYNIPYDKCVVENKSGYPFLKTEVNQNEKN
tara:strand:- start:439 stop:1080 length:642 start_codon:yes stop_codon:yes gene_type:complete